MNMDEKTKTCNQEGKKTNIIFPNKSTHCEGVQGRLSFLKKPVFDILFAPKSVSSKGTTSTIGLETPSQIKLNFCSTFHRISSTTPDLRTFGKDKLMIQKLNKHNATQVS